VDGVRDELRGLAAAAVAPERELAISIEQIHHAFEPCEIDEGSPLVCAALDAVEHVTGERHPTTGTPYGSDVHKLVNDAGIPAITLGPGDIARAHAIDEHIEIDELTQGARVITLLASRLLGPAGRR
ncbi:MAG: M20/M25/M40 family metallo-hydrolase, partial [Gaiellaceae bacterium]